MSKEENNTKITRKEAITKLGKYAALTAIGTFILLSPQKSQAGSTNSLPDPDAEFY